MVWEGKGENLKKKRFGFGLEEIHKEKIVEYAKLTKEKSYKLWAEKKVVLGKGNYAYWREKNLWGKSNKPPPTPPLSPGEVRGRGGRVSVCEGRQEKKLALDN